MEFRVFPQPKRADERVERSPAFGKRQTPPDQSTRRPRSQLAKATALGVGVVVLAYLVVEPF